MSVVVVVGAQWGDEGKGKVVDLFASYSDFVVRYGGGANAGHTLVVRGDKVVLHLVPSGVLHPDTRCIIGNGTVVDPRVLLEELEILRARGLLETPRVRVSERAFLVLPHHVDIDGLRDVGSGIGTTKRGIGPAYQDKVGRRGLRVGDLVRPERFRERLAQNLDAWGPVIDALGGTRPDADALAEEYLGYGERLAPYISDTASEVANAMRDGARILMEGAQGTMLDIDHGTYPFVTSSTVTSGGACAGSGIGPTAIDKVVGITKAYTTRVGAGPFPTELHDAAGERLREAGGEFGATTGRPRRCGWLDIPTLRHAVRVNGISELAITKLDVLAGLGEVPICVEYEHHGARIALPPYDALEEVSPVYETLEGWGDLSGAKSLVSLPGAAQRYLNRIEELVDCPIGIVSIGPGREQTLRLRDPFA
jgi:adenylosuccinate synthase